MTNERARSELEQLYMSLSEEKKKALDVAFKAMEQSMPTMVYPQVDGITPTVVAQADGEKTCGTCRNEDTYHCAECENKSDYEQAQADGEYILKSEAIRVASGYCHPSNIAKELKKLPSVAIPSAEPNTGHWIIIDDCEKFIAKCSECGQIEDSRMIGKYAYCHCGARMVEPQERSEE